MKIEFICQSKIVLIIFKQDLNLCFVDKRKFNYCKGNASIDLYGKQKNLTIFTHFNFLKYYYIFSMV